jgi:hypothetical protein
VLAAGVIGNPLRGNGKDGEIERQLRARVPALHASIVGDDERSIVLDDRPRALTARAARVSLCAPLAVPCRVLAPSPCSPSCA